VEAFVMIMKNVFSRGVFLLGMVAVLPVLCWNVATAGDYTPPTAITVKNATQDAVYANLVLGQPPISNPPNCTYLGRQIGTISDTRLVFATNKPHKPQKVKFTPQNVGIKTQGYYLMAPGERITYHPTTFACTNSTGKCSPAVTFNFFFTKTKYDGSPNNGCMNARFPNATNLAEASVNFGINDYRNVKGATDGLCANSDATDISIVNGVNARIELDMTESKGAKPSNTWPYYQAENNPLGQNANRVGVFGWAATNCTNSDGYPNPSANCSAPLSAPRAKDGVCHTRGGVSYTPIIDPNNAQDQYCAEISDESHNFCNIQRTGNVTGGMIAITFKGLY
jgi:hypothetical protein